MTRPEQVDRPLTEPGDEPATRRGEDQPEERERADHDRARGGAPTPKLWANCGSTGVMRPKPSAMTNAEAMRTQISRGILTPAAASVRGEADTIHQYAVHRRHQARRRAPRHCRGQRAATATTRGRVAAATRRVSRNRHGAGIHHERARAVANPRASIATASSAAACRVRTSRPDGEGTEVADDGARANARTPPVLGSAGPGPARSRPRRRSGSAGARRPSPRRVGRAGAARCARWSPRRSGSIQGISTADGRTMTSTRRATVSAGSRSRPARNHVDHPTESAATSPGSMRRPIPRRRPGGGVPGPGAARPTTARTTWVASTARLVVQCGERTPAGTARSAPVSSASGPQRATRGVAVGPAGSDRPPVVRSRRWTARGPVDDVARRASRRRQRRPPTGMPRRGRRRQPRCGGPGRRWARRRGGPVARAGARRRRRGGAARRRRGAGGRPWRGGPGRAP